MAIKDSTPQRSENYHLLEEYREKLNEQYLEYISKQNFDTEPTIKTEPEDGVVEYVSEEDFHFARSMEDIEIALYQFALENHITPLPITDAVKWFIESQEVDMSSAFEATMRMDARNEAVQRHAELLTKKAGILNLSAW